MKIQRILLIFGIIIPVVFSTYIDQSDVSDLLAEIEAIKDYDFSDVQSEIEVCRDIECEGDENMCLDQILCINEVLSSSDDVPDEFTPSDDLLNVLFNYCDCYTILKDINLDCEEYIDDLIGFHVPLEEMIEAGDTYCSQVDVACDEMETFLNECVDLDGTTVEALCDEYESLILSGDTSEEALCAAQVMTIVLIPEFAVGATETMCDLSTDSINLISQLRETCEFQNNPAPTPSPVSIIDIPQPTNQPTLRPPDHPSNQPTSGPTAVDAVSIKIEFSFSVSEAIEEVEESIRSTLAVELEIEKKDIHSLVLSDHMSVNSIQLRSLVFSYSASCVVKPSLETTSSSSEAALAQTFNAALMSSHFETSLSSSLGSSVTVISTSVWTAMTFSPTSVPSIQKSSKHSHDDDQTSAILGASLSVTAVVIFIGIGVGWFVYKKKGIKWGSYMATEEEPEEVEMSTPTDPYIGVTNPALESSDEIRGVGDAIAPTSTARTPNQSDPPMFESDGTTAWF